MDNAVQAIMMAFGVLVLVIALSIAVYMLSQVTHVSETLLYFSDRTNYYDSVKINDAPVTNFDKSRDRYVDLDTIVPTLYRYYKENFCVKIYDAITDKDNPKLIQIFDVDLENNVEQAVRDNNAKSSSILIPGSGAEASKKNVFNYALKTIYNDSSKEYYMWGVPWTGSTENRKKRVDYFINGSAGYIEGTYVDYTSNLFSSNKDNANFVENFISYSYSGDTFVTADEDELTAVVAKDKIIIIYTMVSK